MLFLQIVNTQATSRVIFDQAPIGLAHLSLQGDWLEVNQRFCEMTGYSREELLAMKFQEITHPDDLPFNIDALARLSSGDLDSYSVEKRYIRKDGRILWVKVAASPIREAACEKPRHLITVIDEINAFKRAQQLRRKAEEKCSRAFRHTPLAIMVMSLKNEQYLDVNEAFERFTGYSRVEAIGRTPYELNLWAEPSRGQAIIDTVLAGGCVEAWEASFQTKDCTIRTALMFAEPIEIDAELCLIAAVLDITDRKRLETELQELSGRLINAQDEERKRIAAELNDSLGQSVTVVSFEASQLARKANGELGRNLQSLCAKIQDIASGIGILSQSVHPSGLDYTGLPWAIETLCRQFTHAYGLQVVFKHEGIPSSLSADVALCLYRIVQDGLKNVVQHAGARRAWIELVWEQRSIRLEIRDKGVGFDIASVKPGLGLLRMRERCRRLNGWLAVHRENGTRIEVHIPHGNIEDDLLNPLLAVAADEQAASYGNS